MFAAARHDRAEALEMLIAEGGGDAFEINHEVCFLYCNTTPTPLHSTPLCVQAYLEQCCRVCVRAVVHNTSADASAKVNAQEQMPVQQQ